MQLNDATAPHV